MKLFDVTKELTRHSVKRYSRRKILKEVVTHHSLTKSGSPQSFARYHVNNRNFPGIAYHAVVDTKIYLTTKEQFASPHCSGRNYRSLGVCLVGNFDDQEVSNRIYKNYIYYLAYVFDRHGVLPVFSHRDFSSKSCPGNLFTPFDICQAQFLAAQLVKLNLLTFEVV